MTPVDQAQDDSPLGRVIALVADLRNRCPWDRVQTRETLRPYLLEEAHELAAALSEDDPGAIREEVGDLMLHLAWQLVLGLELEEFTPRQVADDLVAKMQRRHPQLYGLGPGAHWETLKARESSLRSRLAGLPPTLPDLLMAWRLQQRAAGVGFDWPDAAGPLAKVKEELGEVEAELSANDPQAAVRLEDELGDLLFAVVNLARKAGVSPSCALEGSNRKFLHRFQAVEQMARDQGRELQEMSLEEMDLLWDAAKQAISKEQPQEACHRFG